MIVSLSVCKQLIYDGISTCTKKESPQSKVLKFKVIITIAFLPPAFATTLTPLLTGRPNRQGNKHKRRKLLTCSRFPSVQLRLVSEYISVLLVTHRKSEEYVNIVPMKLLKLDNTLYLLFKQLKLFADKRLHAN